MKVAILGECMVELSQQLNGQYKLGFGGDTLNTAVYLARKGGFSDYFTVLGDDIYSQSMLEKWSDEGVGINQVKVNKGQMPGLYIIENDETGERYFNYWRKNSAARSLIKNYPEIFQTLTDYPMIFLSGISLSLYSEDDLEHLFSFFKDYRELGGIIVFDNNYRAHNWSSVERACNVFDEMMCHTDVALISFDDELSMYGKHNIEECMHRWKSKNVAEIVIKNGHKGCLVYQNHRVQFIPLPKVVKPVDTTAAGDSFNGAYLAAKLAGKSVTECVAEGQACASVVIMHKGAIIDKSISLVGDGLL